MRNAGWELTSGWSRKHEKVRWFLRRQEASVTLFCNREELEGLRDLIDKSLEGVKIEHVSRH